MQLAIAFLQLSLIKLLHIMKFGKAQNGEFYAAEYRPELGRVKVVDKDKSLDDLLTRHGVLTDDKDDLSCQFTPEVAYTSQQIEDGDRIAKILNDSSLSEQEQKDFTWEILSRS